MGQSVSTNRLLVYRLDVCFSISLRHPTAVHVKAGLYLPLIRNCEYILIGMAA